MSSARHRRISAESGFKTSGGARGRVRSHRVLTSARRAWDEAGRAGGRRRRVRRRVAVTSPSASPTLAPHRQRALALTPSERRALAPRPRLAVTHWRRADLSRVTRRVDAATRRRAPRGETCYREGDTASVRPCLSLRCCGEEASWTFRRGVRTHVQPCSKPSAATTPTRAPFPGAGVQQWAEGRLHGRGAGAYRRAAVARDGGAGAHGRRLCQRAARGGTTGTTGPGPLDERERERAMKLFDPHIHMTSRTTMDYEAMATAGIAALVEPSFWLGQPRTHVGTFEDYFSRLLGWERFRASQFLHTALLHALAQSQAKPTARARLIECASLLARTACGGGRDRLRRLTPEEDKYFARSRAARASNCPAGATPHGTRSGTGADSAIRTWLPEERALIDTNTRRRCRTSSPPRLGRHSLPKTKMDGRRHVALVRSPRVAAHLVNSARMGRQRAAQEFRRRRPLRESGVSEADVARIFWQTRDVSPERAEDLDDAATEPPSTDAPNSRATSCCAARRSRAVMRRTVVLNVVAHATSWRADSPPHGSPRRPGERCGRYSPPSPVPCIDVHHGTLHAARLLANGGRPRPRRWAVRPSNRLVAVKRSWRPPRARPPNLSKLFW